ncbi:DUF4169 family protein [Aureimonas sp. AU20]|uniref:DUF4169 family protein n=1 Tax=Aureimonas sp. AU20 TaxID=1349819 RepID=UPI00071FBF39|nr:DUF4169 family protein [Aureimonas sp. AU20]ALN73899.1 hypothetical protein M673_14325 [Aureimonas sp. AU20]
MGEIVNLRLVRKRSERACAETKAAENRARHGRTKADRERDELGKERADRLLDGAKREPPASE